MSLREVRNEQRSNLLTLINCRGINDVRFSIYPGDSFVILPRYDRIDS